MTMRHGDGEEAQVTMCIVIDYADPSSENPFLGGGGELEERKTRRWLDSDGKRKR